jgi:hypothetical protein
MKETPHQLMLPEPAPTPIVSFDGRRASMPLGAERLPAVVAASGTILQAVKVCEQRREAVP